MTVTVKQTHTSTGAKDAIEMGTPKTVTFAVVGDQTDHTINIEIQITDGGTWFLAEGAITDKAPKTTTGPVVAIRANIANLGTATTIDFEVLGERQ